MSVFLMLFFISGMNAMQIIGHRGACGYEPENTLQSFQKAIELGVDAIELDVQLCKTGELVVIHDSTVDRTTNGTGYVSNLSLDELKKLDAGNGTQIPTLQEVFDLVARRVVVNVEMKGQGVAEAVAGLINEYVSVHNWSYDDFWVSSFWHRQLVRFKTLCSHVKTGALFSCEPFDLASFVFFDVDWIGCSVSFCSERLVRDAHALNKPLFVFTVNDAKEKHRVASLGVDGIFSNYPDRERSFGAQAQ